MINATVKHGSSFPDIDETGQPCWSFYILVNGEREIMPFQFTTSGDANWLMDQIVSRYEIQQKRINREELCRCN